MIHERQFRTRHQCSELLHDFYWSVLKWLLLGKGASIQYDHNYALYTSSITYASYQPDSRSTLAPTLEPTLRLDPTSLFATAARSARYAAKEIQAEMRSEFIAAGLSPAFPFGSPAVYDAEWRYAETYQNPGRVLWIVKHCVSQQLIDDLTRLYDELIRGYIAGTKGICRYVTPNMDDTKCVYLELQELFYNVYCTRGYPFNINSDEWRAEAQDRMLFTNKNRLHFLSVIVGRPGTLDYLAR